MCFYIFFFNKSLFRLVNMCFIYLIWTLYYVSGFFQHHLLTFLYQKFISEKIINRFILFFFFPKNLLHPANNLSYIGLTLQPNINSAGDKPNGVFEFGIILLIPGNCCKHTTTFCSPLIFFLSTLNRIYTLLDLSV